MLCCRSSDEIDEDTQDNQEEVNDCLDEHEDGRRRFGGRKAGVLTDLDIKEWTIELRENDIFMEEQNLQTKENQIRKNLEDSSRHYREAMADLCRREQIVNQEIKKLELEKKLLLKVLKTNWNTEANYILKLKVTDDKSVVLSVENFKPGNKQ